MFYPEVKVLFVASWTWGVLLVRSTRAVLTDATVKQTWVSAVGSVGFLWKPEGRNRFCHRNAIFRFLSVVWQASDAAAASEK